MPRNPAISYAYKTAVFRIHNPSRRKRAMLTDALRRNHLAYSKALKNLLPDVDAFRIHRRGKTRESAIAKKAGQVLKPLPLAIGAKAGLASDVAGQLSSYIELAEAQDNPSPPSAAPLKQKQIAFEAALEDLASATTLKDQGAAQSDLARVAKAGRFRPVLYLANRKSDGFLLLCSAETGRYFIYLNLHPKDSRFAHPVSVDGLIDIRTGEATKFTSRTGALFPVKFSRDYQFAEFISKARPQSAKLLVRNGQFEVHITFEYETPKIEPKCRLGVDRGIYNLASLACIDDAGRIIHQKNIDGMQLRHVQRTHERRQREIQRRGRVYQSRSRRAMADEAVHVTANAIVDMAKEHEAQVVIEHLGQMTSRGRKRKRSNFNRVLNRSQYQKLLSVLEYKLAVAGLPKPKTVSAAYTSQTCPVCGHQDRENRPKIAVGDGFKLDRFICQKCGHKDDADLNAGRVIALKRMWRESLPKSQRPKLMKEMKPKYAFETFIRDRAAMRGEGPGG